MLDGFKFEVLGVGLWWGSKSQAIEEIEAWIEAGQRRKQVATVNPEFVMQAVGDTNFNQTLKKIDLKVVDGVGLVWAKRVLASKHVRLAAGFREGWKIIKGDKNEGLVPGVELSEALMEVAARKGWKVMLVGGWEDRAQRAADNFKIKWPKLKIKAIAGEPKMLYKDVLRNINEYSPDVLLVAYGMRKQEEWIQKNREKLDFGVAVGVGRSFDYWSGDLKRAPGWVRRMGLEWLYSLFKEPRRWRRQLALIKFIGEVLKIKK